jgi:hypothetical protein
MTGERGQPESAGSSTGSEYQSRSGLAETRQVVITVMIDQDQNPCRNTRWMGLLRLSLGLLTLLALIEVVLSSVYLRTGRSSERV